MDFPEAPPADVQVSEKVEAEQEILKRAGNADNLHGWEIGECAHLWTENYARGRTIESFRTAAGISMSADQIRQRRKVWEVFADTKGRFPQLAFSHFYAAVTWEDAEDCLEIANEMGMAVAEMKAWRRAQRNEDLNSQPDPSDDAFEATVNDSGYVSDSASAEHEQDQGDGHPDLPPIEHNSEPPAVAAPNTQGEYTPFREQRGKGTTDDVGERDASLNLCDDPSGPDEVLRELLNRLESVLAKHEKPKNVAAQLRKLADRIDPPKKELTADDAIWPEKLDTPECREALDAWFDYKRREKKGMYKTIRTVNQILNGWKGAGPERFIAAMKYSERQSYQGIFEDKDSDTSRGFQNDDDLPF